MPYASGARADFSDQEEDQKCDDIDHHNGCAHRSRECIRTENAQHKADDRQNGRTDRNIFIAFENPHGGQGREDDQRGNQQRSHQPHTQHDDHRGQKRDQDVDAAGACLRCAGEIFVKRDGEDPVIKQYEQHDDHDADADGKGEVCFVDGQDAAEHVVVDIDVDAGRQRYNQDADGQRASGDQRDCCIPFDLCIFIQP